jgi:hypothetical protein
LKTHATALATSPRCLGEEAEQLFHVYWDEPLGCLHRKFNELTGLIQDYGCPANWCAETGEYSLHQLAGEYWDLHSKLPADD